MGTKTVAQKLLVKPGVPVWVSDPAYRDLLEPLPDGARHVDSPSEAAVAVVFCASADAVREALAAHSGRLAVPGALWFAYPKGNKADINRDSLWPIVAEHGMRPNGQVAVDEVWSALRFRLERPDEAASAGRA